MILTFSRQAHGLLPQPVPGQSTKASIHPAEAKEHTHSRSTPPCSQRYISTTWTSPLHIPVQKSWFYTWKGSFYTHAKEVTKSYIEYSPTPYLSKEKTSYELRTQFWSTWRRLLFRVPEWSLRQRKNVNLRTKTFSILTCTFGRTTNNVAFNVFYISFHMVLCAVGRNSVWW